MNAVGNTPSMITRTQVQAHQADHQIHLQQLQPQAAQVDWTPSASTTVGQPRQAHSRTYPTANSQAVAEVEAPNPPAAVAASPAETALAVQTSGFLLASDFEHDENL